MRTFDLRAQDDGYLPSLSLAPTEPALEAGFVMKGERSAEG
jgi:hypothetical protein